METETIKEVLKKVTDSAEQAEHAPRIIRLHGNDKLINSEGKIGRRIRQGDLYLWRVPEDHPRGAQLKGNSLAPDAQPGSRHLIIGAEFSLFTGTKFPQGCAFTFVGLLGPLLVATSPVELRHGNGDILHHASFMLPAGCTIQVVHQLDTKTMQRVRD